MTPAYADPTLHDRLRRKADEYERILNGDGRRLPQNQQEGLRSVIGRMRTMAAKRRLKASAFKEFRALRESAITLCALPESGEPRRYGAGLLSGGRVGGFAGHV